MQNVNCACRVRYVIMVFMIAAIARTPAIETPSPKAARAFLNEIVPRLMKANEIPGASVSIVHGGMILAEAGFGVANLETGSPVTADGTLFRIASITKLFTWTAVMLLVQEGRIDLDEDVNVYLRSIKVPDFRSDPITLRHLMTHTAGFEDIGIGTARYYDPGEGFLEAYLRRHLPDRVRPVGETIMYSNHGAALAGQIIGDVTGIPYEEYIEKFLFDPLGMANTTIRQPLPDLFSVNLADSYISTPGGPRRTTFTIDLLSPAGSACSTARDMATFMMAHLGGKLENLTFLEPETKELMHAQAYTLHPELLGWTLGFQERSLRGHRAIFHDGACQGYVSVLVLVPDLDLGLFAVFNSPSGALGDLITAFGERFIPKTEAELPTQNNGNQTDPTGLYLPARRPYRTIEKLSRYIPVARAQLSEPGVLFFLGREWRAAGDELFRDEYESRLAVLTDRKGVVTGVAVDGYAFDRLPFIGRPKLHAVLAAICIAVILAFVVAFSVRLIRQLRMGNRPPAISCTASFIAVCAAMIIIAAIVGILVVLTTRPLSTGVPAVLTPLSYLPPVAAALGLVAAVIFIVAWVVDRPSIWERMYHAAYVVALSGLVALTTAYGIMGPHLG